MTAGSGRRKKGMRNLEVSLVHGTQGLEVLMCTVFRTALEQTGSRCCKKIANYASAFWKNRS